MMLGETFYPCAALLASRLNISWVSYFPAAPLVPFLTSMWPGCPRRTFVPNPLSYIPQMNTRTTTQIMVRLSHFPPDEHTDLDSDHGEPSDNFC